MRKIGKLAGILCAIAMTAFMGFSASAEGIGQGGGEKNPAAFDGTLVSVDADGFTMLRVLEGGSEELVVRISEETMILDGENGYPVQIENLKAGETVRVYSGPEMTLSLPPIVNGVLVLTGTGAEETRPIYATVQERKENGSANKGTGESDILTTTDGESYVIDSSTVLLPYLTRNIVTKQDLTPGTKILLWKGQANAYVSKIVIFPADTGYGDEVNGSATEGWQLREEGWYFLENGQPKKGWLLDNGEWYYLSPDTGRMQTGFLTLDGKTYFLKEDGKMLKEAHIFSPDENGVLHINFQ